MIREQINIKSTFKRAREDVFVLQRIRKGNI